MILLATRNRHAVIALMSAIVMTLGAIDVVSAQKRSKEIRLAVFNLDAADIPDLKGDTLTDYVVTVLAATKGVQLINREDLSKVAEEQAISLSGLVDARSAVRLGGFVNANYILVGRANKIGASLYIVLKIISVETTVQTTVAVKASVEDGVDTALERLEKQLQEKVAGLKMPTQDDGAKRLQRLKSEVKPLAKATFLIDVSEEHVDRPLRDPAAQMAIVHRLRALGLNTVVPKDPIKGWKQRLLETGKYGEQKIDYLIEGEGVSGRGAVLHGLTSCRARVELRIVQSPGREVTATDRGVAAAVDLVEALAAKQALEDAAEQALDSTLSRLVNEAVSPKKKR